MIKTNTRSLLLVFIICLVSVSFGAANRRNRRSNNFDNKLTKMFLLGKKSFCDKKSCYGDEYNQRCSETCCGVSYRPLKPRSRLCDGFMCIDGVCNKSKCNESCGCQCGSDFKCGYQCTTKYWSRSKPRKPILLPNGRYSFPGYSGKAGQSGPSFHEIKLNK